MNVNVIKSLDFHRVDDKERLEVINHLSRNIEDIILHSDESEEY